MTLYALTLILFAVGLYGLLVKRNVIRILFGLMIMRFAVNLFFVLGGYQPGSVSPLFNPGDPVHALANPLPQALVITSIAMEAAAVALLIALAVRIYQRFGTLDITKIRKLKG